MFNAKPENRIQCMRHPLTRSCIFPGEFQWSPTREFSNEGTFENGPEKCILCKRLAFHVLSTGLIFHSPV